MEIRVISLNVEHRDQIYADMLEDLSELELDCFRIEPKLLSDANDNLKTKGDAVSVSAIILALVSTGGALTIAVGKEGFLSKIAAVLETFVNRKIQIKIKNKDGSEVDIVGPPKNIERILHESLQKESKE